MKVKPLVVSLVKPVAYLLVSYGLVYGNHIQYSHPEIDSTEVLKVVLQNPDFIVCSNWEITNYLYYKKEGEL
ncbi:MAG: hypothetical protein A2Y08_04685 [Planctomycetes bacterium GWA2_40_7]|nr:MAG: hypothetical protein A2Y08_04685 [Planctomycetes bacterium GWA2_40_7]